MSASEPNELARKLKEYRKAKRMSQVDFAAFIGMPYRTYQNYESGSRYPKSMDVVNKMAVALGTTTEELIGSEGGFIIEAGELGSSRDQKRMAQMVSQMTAMFAGGEIDEESRDAAMQALSEAYWKHKNENRERFTTNANKEKKAKKALEEKGNDE